MEILRHGKKHKEDTNSKVVVCDECNCEFKYNSSDIGLVRSANHMEFEYLNCPECGHTIWL